MQAISELPFVSVSKQVQLHNISYGNEFDLQDNEGAGKTHFHMKGAPGLVLKQRQKTTQKWPVGIGGLIGLWALSSKGAFIGE